MSPIGRSSGRVEGSAIARAVEPPLTMLGILLVPLANLHPPGVFFTFSDFIFCVSILLLAASKRLPLLPYGPLTLFWLLGISALSFGLLGSSVLWGDGIRGLVVVGQYIFSYLLLSFVLLGREPHILRRFLKTWIFSIVLINLIGVLAFTFNFDISDHPTWRIVSGSGRLQTTLGAANPAANIIALTLPLIIYMWLIGALKGWLLTFVIPLLLAAVVMTGSVNGLASTGISLILFLALSWNRRVLLGLVVALCATFAWFSIWGTDYLPEIFQRRVLAAFESGEIEQAGTFLDRLVLMREAMEVINENPFLGVGADQFRNYSSSGQPVHNVYFQVWAEGGLVALIGWLIILATPAVAAIYTLHLSRSPVVSFTVLSVGVVFAFVAINSPHMYGRHWLLPLQLALAVAVRSMRQRE